MPSHDHAVGLANLSSALLERIIHLGLDPFASLPALEGLIARLFPMLLVAEMVFLLWENRRSLNRMSKAYKVPAIMWVTNLVLLAMIKFEVFVWTQRQFYTIAPFEMKADFAGFVYAYLVWELSHFIYHYTCHRVRVLWVIHAPHHAPSHMNLSVIFAGSFVENIYATWVRTAICSALGVPLPLLVLTMAIDGCWGSLIHVSEELWPSGAMAGILGRVILSPAHHRIHHARNAEYLDKNYCNTLPVWDMVFGTFQVERSDSRPSYGLTREVKPNNFLDMYFGEAISLFWDVVRAPSIRAAALYVIMPPGWQPK